MKRLKGKSVYQSIAVGPILVWKKQEIQITDTKITDVDVEIARVKETIEQAKEQFRQFIGNKTVVKVSFALLP